MRMFVLVLCLLPSLRAQWIHLPTKGVPKTRDGKPNMAAPTPRTREGKPDFSGMWWTADRMLPCPDSIGGPKDCAEKGLGLAGQLGAGLSAPTSNIASSLPDGLPYTPWSIETIKQRQADPLGDPHVHCLPSSPPRGFTLPHMQKIVQTPELLLVLNEYNASYRQIFMDGRALPVEPLPAWNGYSTAHWEKDTLVIESIGFRDDLWLDMRGNPLTGAARVTERIRRPSYGSLEIEFTVDDKQAYTKPWTVKLTQFRVLDTEMMDEMCLENEKSVQHTPVR